MITFCLSIIRGTRVPRFISGALVLSLGLTLSPASLAAPHASTNQSPACDLAAELFAEGNWLACRTECSRVVAAQPADPQAALLKAVAELRCGMVSTGALTRLCETADTPAEIASMAHYELGRALLRTGDAV